MTKILVADDEADLEVLIRQKFRQKIRDQHYEFVFAINGNDALAKMLQHPDVDIVLSDINMPEMDGLTLLTKLGEASPMVKAVMVSAYGDMDNIRTAMNRGAFDFVTKPVNFVDENVLSFMGSREFETSLMQNETVEASVAFIDICSFTSISENESPDTVVKLLNSYFDVMVKEIIAQGGYIDKFIGDAIMAVFRGNFHLDRAIDACLAVRSQIEKLPSLSDTVSFIPKVSIGINTGEMISDNIGSATLRRLDYTVIGDTVNTAQRLQSVAGPGQIIINEASYEKVNQSFSCRKVGEAVLKNKTNPVNIYEVLD